MRQTILLPRRTFLHRSAAALALSGVAAPFIIRSRAALAATSDTALPGLPYGIMAGDVGTDSAVIWSRSDRPALRMIVEYATSDSSPTPSVVGRRRSRIPTSRRG